MTHRTTHAASVLVAIVAVAGLQSPGKAQDLSREVPSRAPVYDIPLRVADAAGTIIPVAVQVAIVGPDETNKKAEYCVLPAFQMVEGEVRYGGRPPRPLLSPDGRISPPIDRDPDATITMRVRDLWKSPLRTQIYEALAQYKDPGAGIDLQARTRFEPKLRDDWKGTLAIRDTQRGGALRPLGEPFPFSRNQAEHDLVFHVTPYLDPDRRSPNPAYDALLGGKAPSTGSRDLEGRAWADALVFTLTGQYSAEFFETDFKVTGEFMDETLATIINKVVSRPGRPSTDLFIPVGSSDGNINHDFNIAEEFKSAIRFRIQINDTGQADLTILNRFLDKSLDLFTQKVSLDQMDQSKIVSFLTESGVQATTPINKVTEASSTFQKMSEEQLHDFLGESSLRDKTVGVQADLNVDVPLTVEVDAHVKTHYHELTANDQKRVRDRFRKSMETASKMVKGEIKLVSAMNIQEVKNVQKRSKFTTELVNERFRIAFKDFKSNISLQPFICDPGEHIGVSRNFRRALCGILEASRRQFLPIMGELKDAYYTSILRLPDDDGKLQDPRIYPENTTSVGSAIFFTYAPSSPSKLEMERLFQSVGSYLGSVINEQMSTARTGVAAGYNVYGSNDGENRHVDFQRRSSEPRIAMFLEKKDAVYSLQIQIIAPGWTDNIQRLPTGPR